MAETVVKLRLNQQQLELLDRTIAQGVAPDRVALVRPFNGAFYTQAKQLSSIGILGERTAAKYREAFDRLAG